MILVIGVNSVFKHDPSLFVTDETRPEAPNHLHEKSPRRYQSERPDKPWDTIHIALVKLFLLVIYILLYE